MPTIVDGGGSRPADGRRGVRCAQTVRYPDGGWADRRVACPAGTGATGSGRVMDEGASDREVAARFRPPHDLRHAGLTLAAQSGATLAEVVRHAGHSSPRAAMIY